MISQQSSCIYGDACDLRKSIYFNLQILNKCNNTFMISKIMKLTLFYIHLNIPPFQFCNFLFLVLLIIISLRLRIFL